MALEGLMVQLRQTPAPAAAPAAPPADTSTEVPDTDIAEYGAELVAASRRWAGAQLGPEIAQLRAQVARLEATGQQVQQVTAQSQVTGYLDRTVDRWQAIDNDPAFFSWLAQTDPFTGTVRHAMLKQAYAAGDGPRTAAFFQAFLVDRAATTPPITEHTVAPAAGQTPQTPQPAPTTRDAGAGSVSLDSLTAPGRGRPASSGAPADKKIWSQADIQAFYSDGAKGRFAGREAEKNALEADIFAAGREGRLR